MVDDNLLKHPKDQRFYQVIALVMGFITLNPQYWQWFQLPQNVIYTLQRKSFIYSATLAVISQTTYLVVNHSVHEFKELSMMYAILPVTIIMFIKVSSARTEAYKKVMKELMTKIHLYTCYTKNKDEYIKEVLIKAEKLVRWSYIYLLVFCYSCFAGFEIVPVVHNLDIFREESLDNITTRLEIVVHFWLPFDYEFNFYNWLIVQISCVYCGFATVTAIAVFDGLSLSFIYHITGHIKIIKHQIKTTFHADMTQEDITLNLVEISRYYTFITETLKNIEDAFGYNVASIYIHNLFAGGLFIYQVSMSGTETATILTYGLMIPLYMGILIIVSFALEYIRIVGDDIPDLIYELHWYDMSLPNQKLLLMVLCQVQPVLEFNAACNIKTGVQPAIDILKTTFSFYVMIKSTV